MSTCKLGEKYVKEVDLFGEKTKEFPSDNRSLL